MNERNINLTFSVNLVMALLLLLIFMTNSKREHISLAQTGSEATLPPAISPFAGGYGSLPAKGQYSHNLTPQATFSNTNIFVIESYQAHDNTMTMRHEHSFVGDWSVVTDWYFVPVAGDLLVQPSFSSTGTGACNWISTHRRVECTGNLTDLTLSYQVNPMVQNSRLDFGLSMTWSGMSPDIISDLYYPSSLIFISTSTTPSVNESGHLGWVKSNDSTWGTLVSFQIPTYIYLPIMRK